MSSSHARAEGEGGGDGAVPPEVPFFFEARSTPPRSFTTPGFVAIAGLLGAGALGASVLFVALGAWPVLLFMGAEIPVAVALVWLHHRRSGRALETVSLADGVLRVARTDARGRREVFEAEAYWARVAQEAGPDGALRLRCRGGRSVEVGRFLGAEEKAAFAEALAAALRRAREPRFDNAVLRDGD